MGPLSKQNAQFLTVLAPRSGPGMLHGSEVEIVTRSPGQLPLRRFQRWLTRRIRRTSDTDKVHVLFSRLEHPVLCACTCDAVLALDVLEYLDDDIGALRAAAQLVASGRAPGTRPAPSACGPPRCD